MPPVVKRQSPNGPRLAKSGSVLDRIRPVEIDEGSDMSVLLYGQSGTGKTRLWSTFPGPILSVVCSGGLKSGELKSILPENRKKVSGVTLQASSEMREIIADIEAKGTFRTVVLDHVSGLQDLVLKEILGIEELPAQKSWGLATQQQYGQCTMQAKEILRAMLNLSANVVIIAQERTFGGKEDGVSSELIQPTVGAAVTPSLASWLNPACDYVIQMFKRPVIETKVRKVGNQEIETRTRGKGVEYCARTEPHDVYMTKFRTASDEPLPDVIVNPTYDKIVDLP